MRQPQHQATSSRECREGHTRYISTGAPRGLGTVLVQGLWVASCAHLLTPKRPQKPLLSHFYLFLKPLRKILLHTYSVPCGSVFLSQVTELDVQGEMMCEVGEWTCSGSSECMGPESHGAAFPWRIHHGSQLSPALSPQPSFYPREVVTVLSILS